MFVLWFLVGLVLLLGGAELLVRGGGRIALALRIPVIVVALTIVAFGTSMPEILVSMTAALRDSPDMTMGNVTGSNIANIALVLGAAAMVAPLSVGRELIRREIPALVGLQMAVPIMLWGDSTISRLDGFVLLSMGVLYNVLLIRDAMVGRRALDDDDEVEGGGDMVTNVALLLLGLAMLMLGAQFFIDGAEQIGAMFGVSDRVISLTAVALGTSAPEVVTALVSAFRGETDMAVGNSLGSNILNLSLALGLTAMVHPITVSDAGAWRDIAVAIVLSVLLVPIVLRGRQVSRIEGALMVAAYVVYLVMLPSL